MKISVLAVLVASFLLVMLVDDSEGWGRRRWRVRVRWRRALTYGVLASKFMGKRSADNPPCPPDDDEMDQATAQKLLQKLGLECPNFGVNGQKLRKNIVMAAFDKVDADNDNALDQAELDDLENVLDAYEACSQETADAVKQ